MGYLNGVGLDVRGFENGRGKPFSLSLLISLDGRSLENDFDKIAF